MFEYRQIILRLRSGEGLRPIARATLVDRKTIRKIRDIAQREGWITSQNVPDNETIENVLGQPKKSLPKSNALFPHKTRIEEWYRQGIQASTIYLTLQRQHEFTGGYNAVQRFVKTLKDKSTEVTILLEFKPGESAQVDFGAGPKLINEITGEIIKTWIFVMVLGWSRHMYAEIILKQDVETWLGCHRRAFCFFNGVPGKMIIDNAKCAITKACYYDHVVQRAYAEYAEGYGFTISPCPPREPKKKGRVESGVKYVKKNFIPLRNFRDLVDANKQLQNWILETAGNRIHGTTRKKPLTLFEQTEKLFLKVLPKNPPECAIWGKVKLHSDCHIMFLKCRYSAPYHFVKQELWLRATETTVRLYNQNTLVAVHPRLCKPGSKHTLEEHLPPHALAYCLHDPQWCLERAKKIGIHCEQIIQKLLTDSVTDYLRAAQGIISLHKKFGDERLDAACRRALAFQSPRYKTVKSILQKGLEYAPLPEQEAFDGLAETYTGNGRFCRDTSKLLQ